MRRASAASVEFRNVSKHFGAVVAVRSVSFVIEPGTLVTLLGPSGCGKTTTLRMVAGLDAPTEGQILIGGRDVTHLSPFERNVSMVFQSYALFPHMSVLENVAYGPLVQGDPKSDALSRARATLDMVGLKGLDERFPSELSGGQQQRVAVARGLVLEPEVLLFDEPLSNLDAKLRRRVRQDIRRLQRDLNLTVIYVTHDQEEALAVSDRIIVMSEAVIAQSGTPRELYEHPKSEFIAGFIGDANMVSAELVSIQAGRARIRVKELEVELPAAGFQPGPVRLSIRPESLRLHSAPPARPTLSGKIEMTDYLGSCMEYLVQSSLGVLFAVDSRVSHPFAPGTSVWIELDDRGVTLVPKS